MMNDSMFIRFSIIISILGLLSDTQAMPTQSSFTTNLHPKPTFTHSYHEFELYPHRIYPIWPDPGIPISSVKQLRSSAIGSQSTFDVTYMNLPSSDYQLASEYALTQIANIFPSSVAIDTKITFVDDNPNSYLAYGSSSQFIRLDDGTYYQVAAAESILGSHQNLGGDSDSQYDVLIVIYLGTIPWYTSTSGTPSNSQYDLVTVLMHETIHALFYTGLLQQQPSESSSLLMGWSTSKASFDLYLASKTGCAIYGYDNSQDIASSVTQSNLYLYSSNERIMELYAPTTYSAGSSVYHYDPDQFNAQNEDEEESDALMIPSIGKGFKHHFVGRSTKQIMGLILSMSADAPSACVPGTYESSANDSDDIAGMSPVLFGVVVGVSVLVGVGLAIAVGVYVHHKRKSGGGNTKHEHKVSSEEYFAAHDDLEYTSGNAMDQLQPPPAIAKAHPSAMRL